jgi:hypothetical protein
MNEYWRIFIDQTLEIIGDDKEKLFELLEVAEKDAKNAQDLAYVQEVFKVWAVIYRRFLEEGAK